MPVILLMNPSSCINNKVINFMYVMELSPYPRNIFQGIPHTFTYIDFIQPLDIVSHSFLTYQEIHDLFSFLMGKFCQNILVIAYWRCCLHLLYLQYLRFNLHISPCSVILKLLLIPLFCILFNIKARLHTWFIIASTFHTFLPSEQL